MDDDIRYVEGALGLQPRRLRRTKRGKLIGTPRLTEGETARLRAFHHGILTRNPLGVFVYNQWLDPTSERRYASSTATVRQIHKGWEASVKGATAFGETPQEAAAKLTLAIVTVIELADLYQSIVSPQAGANPKPRSGGAGSYRSSPRAQARKG
jgi:hypothetical protein